MEPKLIKVEVLWLSSNKPNYLIHTGTLRLNTQEVVVSHIQHLLYRTPCPQVIPDRPDLQTGQTRLRFENVSKDRNDTGYFIKHLHCHTKAESSKYKNSEVEKIGWVTEGVKPHVSLGFLLVSLKKHLAA